MGYAAACLGIISLMQCIKQAQWPETNPVLALPGVVQNGGTLHAYANKSLGELLAIPRGKLDSRLPKEVLSPVDVTNAQFLRVWDSIPRIAIQDTKQVSGTLRVQIRRLNRGYTDRNLIYAPKFSKPQQESWFVCATSSDGDKLLSLQRLSLNGRGDGSVELKIPESFVGVEILVKVLSDGWRGVDVEKPVVWNRDTAVDV